MSIEDIKPDTSLYTDPADRLIALGLAMKAGKEIERRGCSLTEWEAVLAGVAGSLLAMRIQAVAEGVDYRVAPPKPREIYILWNHKNILVDTFSDESLAESSAKVIGGTYAKFVEAL